MLPQHNDRDETIMEFTGERYIPKTILDSEIDIEHHQRYLSIKDLVKGKVVVDAASGAGYGSHILAGSAAQVYGLDISASAVQFATQAYKKNNLQFCPASITALPFANNSIDVIVSFETIEHVAESAQQSFLRECKRILKAEGLFIISTPDKAIYSDLPNYKNEFHVKEFYKDEFSSFLSTFFKEIAISRQFISLGYFLTGGPSSTFTIINPDPIKNEGKYLVAFCSDAELPTTLAQSTIFVDQKQVHQQKVDRVIQLQGEIVEKNEIITNLEMWVQKCRDTIAERDADLARQGNHINEIQKQLTHHKTVISTYQQELDSIHHSTSWKIIKIYDSLRKRFKIL